MYLKYRKAATIIYHKDNDRIEILLVKPSNPKFGGPDFQLPKGQIHEKETPEQTALRESKEEAGLVEDNILQMFYIGDYVTHGLDNSYILTVFGVEVKDKERFYLSDYEISDKGFFSLEKAQEIIRKEQKEILRNALYKLEFK